MGIRAEIELVEWSVWLDRVYTAREYEMTIIGLTGKLSAYRNIVRRYVSDYREISTTIPTVNTTV